MATDSATASLPHALIWAYKNLCNSLQSEGRPHNFCATREAISGFVCQWRGIPAGQQELERRATFLVRSSGEGSPWKQAARNAVKFLRERKKIDDPSLEVAWIKAGLTTPKFLRYTVQTGVDFSTPLNDVIDALRWVLNRKRLSEKAQCALDEWRRQSVELYDQATAMQADGCRWLNLVYGDLRENPTKPSGALRAVELTPDSCFGMPDAAESLLHWAADQGAATGENRGQRDTKGDQNIPPDVASANDPRDKWIYAQAIKGVAWGAIRRKLDKKPAAWERIETDNGVKDAATRYAKRHNLSLPPPRKAGRPAGNNTK
jgi:hypothetical protein